MNKVVVVCNKEHEKGYEDYAGVCLLCEVEYHKNRAARWRAEAYKLVGKEVELPWVGLTDEEMYKLWLGTDERMERIAFGKAVQAKLKEKNSA